MRNGYKLQLVAIKDLLFLRRNPQYLTPDEMDSLKASIKRDGFLAQSGPWYQMAAEVSIPRAVMGQMLQAQNKQLADLQDKLKAYEEAKDQPEDEPKTGLLSGDDGRHEAGATQAQLS
jgi:hypothetical protein